MAEDHPPFLARWARLKAQARSGQPVPEPAAPAVVASELAAPGLADPPVPAAPASWAAVPRAAAAPATLAAEVSVIPAAAPAQTAAPQPPPALTLADVAELTRESDYSGFVARGVTPDVRNAALKKLFTDPHFNVMDGLDIYIDDYGKPDPLPPGMLRQMVQSKLLGLFDEEDKADAAAAAATAAAQADHALAPDPTESCKADPAPPALAAPDTLPPDTATHEDLAVQLQPDDDAGCAGPDPGAGQDPWRQH